MVLRRWYNMTDLKEVIALPRAHQAGSSAHSDACRQVCVSMCSCDYGRPAQITRPFSSGSFRGVVRPRAKKEGVADEFDTWCGDFDETWAAASERQNVEGQPNTGGVGTNGRAQPALGQSRSEANKTPSELLSFMRSETSINRRNVCGKCLAACPPPSACRHVLRHGASSLGSPTPVTATSAIAPPAWRWEHGRAMATSGHYTDPAMRARPKLQSDEIAANHTRKA